MKKVFFILFLIPLVVWSQNKQPKVGLVLSGGGAKGFAHVGVLKAIEASGLQISYIGGTSMGAIVGGLYASGYSAIQIEEIVKSVDFFKLLQDINPRNAKPFFEKVYGEKHSLVLPINKGKIGLPQGFSKGQNALSFLNYLLSPVDSINDFSKLPIPFYCIATDVENGNQVKLTEGSLPKALRASGSFPTLLNPIEIDGKLLIDGGVANNFPVDEMKKTGVDIIIGVDVQSKLFNKDNIKSAIDVLSQITNYDIYRTNPKQVALTDVYIHPNIYDYSVVSFDKSKEILQRGIEEAKKYRHVFDSISLLQPIKKPQPGIKNLNANYVLNEIEIHGNVNYTRAYVLGKLKISVGDLVNTKKLMEKISYLSSTENFRRIDYRVKTEKGKKKLILTLEESKKNASIRLGVHYDLVYKSGVLINYNKKNIFSKNDVISLDLVIGDTPRYNLHYFVDNGFYYSYGFNSSFNSFRTTINTTSSSVNKIDLEYTDFTNSLYIQTTFDRKFAVGLGVEHKTVLSETSTILGPNNSSFKYDDSDYTNALAYLKLDTYDDKYFPTKGAQIDLGFKWYLSSSDYNKNFVQFSQIKGKISFVKTFFERASFEYISEGGFTLGEVESKAFDFLLGGYNQNFINNFIPFYGYEVNSLAEQTFLKSTFIVRYKVTKNQYVQFIGNYARAEDSVLKNGEIFDNTKSGYALGYSLKTLLGPLELKYAWSPDTNNHFWYFNLGFWF